jgi:hypothetical protein
MWVETNTGIAVVIPAWHLSALLNDERLVKQRMADDEKLLRERPDLSEK